MSSRSFLFRSAKRLVSVMPILAGGWLGCAEPQSPPPAPVGPPKDLYWQPPAQPILASPPIVSARKPAPADAAAPPAEATPPEPAPPQTKAKPEPTGAAPATAAPLARAAASPRASGTALGPHAHDLGSCRIFPPNNPWNLDISNEPVDPDSARYLARMNAGDKHLHPDFGSRADYGIPWFVVSSRTPRTSIEFSYADESDRGPYPFPPDAPIEGGPGGDGDRHVIAIDRDQCRLYEAFACQLADGRWSCDSGAIFDLASNKSRPEGWTSADAAGLPIFPGLVRHDEVTAGEIKHALRFTVAKTQRAYVFPARHAASKERDPDLPPLGLRVRLKRDFDLAPFRGAARVVLKALQRYGMILADNGSDWFLSGESNPAWDDEDLAVLKRVPASAFEVVRLGPIRR